MKVHKLTLNKNKLLKSKIIKTKIYKTPFFIYKPSKIENVNFRLKKALYIIHKYLNNNKQIPNYRFARKTK